MELKATEKNLKFIAPVVFLFTLARSLVFANSDMIGYSFEKKEVLFNFSSALYLASAFLYSILLSAFISAVYKKYGTKVWLPCLLLLADTVFLINQKRPSVLIIHVLWLAYLNSTIFEKPVLKASSQAVFLFASAILSPETAIGFIPPVLITNLLPDIACTKNKTSTTISCIISPVAALAGIIIQKLLYASNAEFKSFSELINPTLFTEGQKIFGVLVMSVPGIAAGAYFISLLYKSYKATQKRSQKKGKEKNKFESVLNVSILAYSLLFAACLFGGYEAISSASLIAPIIIIMLISAKEAPVDSALEDIDKLVFKCPLVAVSVLMSAYYFCLKFYFVQFGASLIATFFIWNK